jgi:pimeloyl-ACP methyl ester carboxylesterase
MACSRGTESLSNKRRPQRGLLRRQHHDFYKQAGCSPHATSSCAAPPCLGVAQVQPYVVFLRAAAGPQYTGSNCMRNVRPCGCRGIPGTLMRCANRSNPFIPAICTLRPHPDSLFAVLRRIGSSSISMNEFPCIGTVMPYLVCLTLRPKGIRTMTSFVLVHGAFHGGWCYQRVARKLRGGGHEVYTPTLTGLGERSHLADMPINLDTHITDIVNVILWEDLNDVVLVGHSYGAIVVNGVADQIAERIGCLVYLDPILAEDGDTLLSLRPDLKELLLRQASEDRGLFVCPRPAAGFGLNAADQAWVDAKMTPQPVATFVQALRLTGRVAEVPSRVYIYAADGPFGSPAKTICERQRGQPHTQVFGIAPSGHDIMIDQPDQLTDILTRSDV